ncbi:hypothetical protein IGI04_013544 [Brassica rapa subsp. trilocularis]|uniref:CCHC-type domain-containing protein n=1 Tax=Brassica rapa subsp. trilocularis TaxID=1813537 RepID=A0ABQ7NBJ4_BRACM|nr:hypothetical protein IGI04_013544 [Brassica rapa subsp. trilocularis]
MGEGTMIDLGIHVGGSMEKINGDYKYVGELFEISVQWELYDISWDKFLRFSREDAKIIAPIRFVWYKDIAKEMNTVTYVFEENPDDMFLLMCLAKEAGAIDVFIEYDVSDVRYNEEEEFPESDGEEEVERPLEDEEPEQSEEEDEENPQADENETAEGEVNVAPQAGIVDENVTKEGEEREQAEIGDEVVQDAGDGGEDERFRAVFEEGSMAKLGKEAYQNLEENETAEREAEESDEECVLEEDAANPDTPIGSEEDSKHVYEVNEFECGYSVNLATHQCACRKWDLTGKSTRHGRIPHCSQCKQAGHIKTSCKNESVTVEGPKNRRGRPRKHPNEDHPKPPPKPKGRKKTPVSSSQPITSTDIIVADVSSSAPQPSSSTNQVKPHVKKAPTGRPLKIRKTAAIPFGVGTFWSPYTDRPFEVFGDRVYDRSNLNPQDPNIQPAQGESSHPPTD